MTESVLQEAFPAEQFTNNERKEIVNCFSPTNFSKGDHILKAGQTASYYYFVETGFLRSYAMDTEGIEVTTNFFGPNNILMHWPSFLLRQPSREFTHALTDCKCWTIGFEAFEKLFHSMRNFRKAGRARLAGSYFDLQNRSLAMITDTAKDRYLRLVEEHPELIQNIPLKYLSSYLGITDTSLSRIRAEVVKC